MRAVAALALLSSTCAGGPEAPAALDTRSEQCRHCRMAVSDARFASQLVAPYEEPLFFDDIGCLRDYLKTAPSVPPGSIAYVADHRTKAWLRAAQAVYTRDPRVETPMGSHVLAHADTGGGGALSARDVFGPAGPPDGTP